MQYLSFNDLRKVPVYSVYVLDKATGQHKLFKSYESKNEAEQIKNGLKAKGFEAKVSEERKPVDTDYYTVYYRKPQEWLKKEKVEKAKLQEVIDGLKKEGNEVIVKRQR